MNIFVLDENPAIAAQMLCDKHIVKMPLETAQLLSNVFSIALKAPNPFVSATDQNIAVPYKLTHSNHPCSLWARQSKGNFCWLIEYGKELCKEYTQRYKRKHKSEEVIDWCDSNKDLLIFRSTDMQAFIQALPDRYKCSSSIKAQTDKICQKIKKLFILYFLNIISHGSASAVIAEIDNGALSARVKAWFWVERSNHWWSLIMTTPRRRLYNLTVPS